MIACLFIWVEGLISLFIYNSLFLFEVCLFLVLIFVCVFIGGFGFFGFLFVLVFLLFFFFFFGGGRLGFLLVNILKIFNSF